MKINSSLILSNGDPCCCFSLKFDEIKNRTLKCGFIFHFFLAKNYANFLICAANLDLWFAALLA